MRKFIVVSTALLLGISLTACAGNHTTAQNPQSVINHTGKQATGSGLIYQAIKSTNGKKPTLQDEVEIRFTSYNPQGEVLEGTLNNVPVILPISEMFAGLQESLLLMPVGSVYEFDIPAHLGYQEEGKANKQAVKYRIELLAINP